MKQLRIVAFVGLTLAFLLSGCGRGKKVTLEEQRAGRDRELLEQGLTEIKRGRYGVGQQLLQVLISTYPDSPYLPAAKMGIADAFFKEGTSESRAQAEVEYTDFAHFFPNHPWADDALLQVAILKMVRIQPPDRDQKPTRDAERALLAAAQKYPSSDRKSDIERWLKAVREVKAQHEMYVGDQYAIKSRLKGARRRYMEVVQHYPTYSRRDEALYKLGEVLFEEEEPEQAAEFFAWVVREHPNSEYRKRAAEMLEKIGKPVPEVAPIEIAQLDNGTTTEKGFFSPMFDAVKKLFGGVDLDLPKEGVLVKNDESAEQLIAAAMAYSKPTTVTTPDAGIVAVGQRSTTPGTGPAQGTQTVTIGGSTGNTQTPTTATPPNQTNQSSKQKPDDKKKKEEEDKKKKANAKPEKKEK
jgi:outer membrane protein assembly factor BamD